MSKKQIIMIKYFSKKIKNDEKNRITVRWKTYSALNWYEECLENI